MTQENPNHDQQKAQLVESLLDALCENESARAQSLVTEAMENLDHLSGQESFAETKVASKDEPRGKRGNVSWHVAIWVTAAMILLAITIPFFDSSRKAMAAVDRSIRQARADVGRQYTVSTVLRTYGNSVINRKANLFVKGGDRLAIRVNLPLQRHSIWFGNNQERAWVVPPIGPVIEGNTEDLAFWLSRQKNIETPYLHVTTFLERMRDSYQLEKLPNEALPNLSAFGKTLHIVGNRKPGEPSNLPKRIELWADSQEGIALKLIATWILGEGKAGRESITIEFEKEIDLADDFFSPNSHGGEKRPRIQFGLKTDQD